jgi:hypothetical protein
MPLYTKLYFYSLLFFYQCLSLPLQAQQWKQLEQKPLNVRYDLPRNWYVGGVMKEKNCHCYSGTLNSAFKGHLNMVLFESSAPTDADVKKQDVWGYTFLENVAPSVGENLGQDAAVQFVKAQNFIFEQTVSTWREDTTLQVIRLYAKVEKTHYLLYFWGSASDLKAQADVIDRIIKSVEYIY